MYNLSALFISPPPVKPEGTIGLHSVCPSLRQSVRQSVCLSVTLVFRTYYAPAIKWLGQKMLPLSIIPSFRIQFPLII